MLVALAVAVPFILLTAGIVWQLAANERETRREAILFSTRTLMNAVDTILGKQIAVAQILATSPTLNNDDLAGFRQEAERAMQGLSGGWIVLSDQDGQQLVNSARPGDAELPRRSPQAIELQRRAIDTGQVQISDVFTGAALQIRPSSPSRFRCGAKASRRCADRRAWSRASSCRCSSNGTCRKAGSRA